MQAATPTTPFNTKNLYYKQHFKDVLPKTSNAHTVFDMTKEECLTIERKMYGEEGSFLAEGEKLRNVCVQDLNILKKRGVSCGHIRNKLKELVSGAKKIASLIQDPDNPYNVVDKAVVDNRYKVRGFNVVTNGAQNCPFSQGENCHEGRGIIKITNLKTGQKMSFSPLNIDLISDHAFFEGHVPYRVDPENLCDLLELHADVGMKKRAVLEKTLKPVASLCYEKEIHEIVRNYPGVKEIPLNENTTAYAGFPFIKDPDLENIEIFRSSLEVLDADEVARLGKKYYYVFREHKDLSCDSPIESLEGVEISISDYPMIQVFEIQTKTIEILDNQQPPSKKQKIEKHTDQWIRKTTQEQIFEKIKGGEVKPEMIKKLEQSLEKQPGLKEMYQIDQKATAYYLTETDGYRCIVIDREFRSVINPIREINNIRLNYEISGSPSCTIFKLKTCSVTKNVKIGH